MMVGVHLKATGPRLPIFQRNMSPIEFLRLRNSGDCSQELKFLRERNEEGGAKV